MIWLALAGATARAATLTVPPVTDCRDGLGRATLRWEAEGPVQIRVNEVRGPAMTGLEAAAGNATTDYWVRDAMLFVLVDAAGREVARASAVLACGGSAAVRAALAQGSYFPLEVGNQWVYRLYSRFFSSTYATWTVTRHDTYEGRRYAVIRTGTVERWFREDEAGRIWELQSPNNGRRETLYLDPAASPRRITDLVSPLGVWPEALESVTPDPLLRDTRIFARGLGLLSSSARLLTGSSGGFTDSYELVWAKVGGSLRFGTPAPALGLAVETTDLDVSGRKVTNCALPCYYVACGIGSPVDPPGTYRPCFQARVESGGAAAIELELSNEAGVVLARATVKSDVEFVQLPLYGKPDEPFAAGRYRVTARQGEEQSAWVTVRVR